MADVISGVCLCGAQRYELQGALQGLLHCHCSRCRKHHGAPFASFVRASPRQLRWVAGEGQWLDAVSSPQRPRRACQVCGAVAPAPHGEHVLVPAGNLQGQPGVGGGEHIFVGSRAVWHVIADGLPQHEGAPPGWSSELQRPAVPGADVPGPNAPAPVEPGTTHGSCLCGAVSFVVSGAPARWLQCHCSRCRRARSAAHGSNTFFPLAQFSWGTGRELVRSYRPPEAERFTTSFCVRCGGAAPTQRENVPFVLVPAALFDGDPAARPQAHIHIASQAPWYEVRDTLPQFAELPPP